MSSYDTIFPADTVEFCPFSENTDILVCGTYKLQATENDDGLGPLATGSGIDKEGSASRKATVQKRIGKVVFLGVYAIVWIHQISSILLGIHCVVVFATMFV